MNEKEQRHILFNYLIYFITFIILCCIGIKSTLAVSITDSNYATKYYWYVANDNTSTTSTAYRTGSDNKLTLYGATAPTYDNGEGFNGFYNRINYSITKGSIYTLTLTINYNGLLDGEFNTSHINNRLLTTDYVHCSNCTVTAVSGSIRRYNSTSPIGNLYDYVVQMSYTFIATSSVSEWYIGTYTGSDRTLGVDNHTYTATIIVNSLDISNDNSSTIINQNDTIINQNQQMIEQSQQNTQDIIDNQNQNTQDIIDNLNNCTTYNYNESTLTGDVGLVSSAGTYYPDNTGWTYSKYLPVNKGKTYTATFGYGTGIASYCLFDKSKTRLSCSNYTPTTSITPSFDGFIRLSFRNSGQFTFTGEYCSNRLDETTDAVNGLNAALTDHSPISMSSLGDTAGWLPAGPIDSIINLPLNLLNNLLTALNGTCQPITIPLPYIDRELPIPCISTIFNQIDGLPNFWNWVGIITSVMILYKYLINLYKYYDDLTTLKANFISDFGGAP